MVAVSKENIIVVYTFTYYDVFILYVNFGCIGVFENVDF